MEINKEGGNKRKRKAVADKDRHRPTKAETERWTGSGSGMEDEIQATSHPYLIPHSIYSHLFLS
jgi:hypothetical protein